MEKNNTNFRDAYEAGMVAGHVEEIDGSPFLVLPRDCDVEDLEHLQERPRRINREVTLDDVASFCEYFKAFKTEGSRIFAAESKRLFKAILDYHAKANAAAWCSHTAAYACPKSKEWDVWTGNSGRNMTQQQFAEFIEDNLPDIREPVGAKMLEISRSLEAKKSVKFASSVRLDNGAVEFLYEENIAGTAKKGKLEIPEHFKVGIPVFNKGSPYEVKARFRYRIAEGGALTMWYDLHRPHKIEESAFKSVLEEIKKNAGTDVLMGWA